MTEEASSNTQETKTDDCTYEAEFLSAQQGDEESNASSHHVVLEHLSSGFRALRKHRDAGPSETTTIRFSSSSDSSPPDFLRAALVNFIDPTMSTGSLLCVSPTSTSTTSSSFKINNATATSPGKPGLLPTQKAPLELYKKLSFLFQRDYQCTLRRVPYHHHRGAALRTVDTLYVQTFLTKSHGGLVMDDDSEELPWGGIASGGGGLTGDASEWHATPYCHVYLAACESLEHYRTKVKPSIQAFLSQIEAAAKANQNNTTSTASSSLSSSMTSNLSKETEKTTSTTQYVIVFCPTGDHSTPVTLGAGGSGTASSDQGGGGRSVAGWGSRVAAAGRRMARDTSADHTTSSVIGGLQNTSATSASLAGAGQQQQLNSSIVSSDAGSVNEGADLNDGSLHNNSNTTTSLTAHLSRVDRELARRFAVDFSAGKVCTLSTLVTESAEQQLSSSSTATTSDLQRLEWREFLRCLGLAIGDGFRDRCLRYDEEIRQLDSLRAVSIDNSIQSVRARTVLARKYQKQFDMSHFFLLKESLAFTYEQMCLPSEALLQYDELRAVLPDIKTATPAENNESQKSNIDNTKYKDLEQIALRGDVVQFRRHLRAMEYSKPNRHLAPIFQLYLFSRETSLLFQQNNSVMAAERCKNFVKSMYEYKIGQLEETADTDTNDESRKQAILSVERWAFDFCWDVKTACDIYLADDVTESQHHNQDDHKKQQQQKSRSQKNDIALARCICDLLDFARLRLMSIGDLVLGVDNPVRSHLKQFDKVLFKEWKPWKPYTSKEDESSDEEDCEPPCQDDFIQDALSSSDAFLTRFLELLKVMVAFNRFAGRKRCAARLSVEVAGIYVDKGNPERATVMLREAAHVYETDQWQSCHFMLLFRLAAYQREVSTADDYIDTLVQCFSPAHTKSVPAKALGFLLADLESVLHSSMASRKRLMAKPIFEPLLGLDGYKPSARAGSSRELLKKVYSVGDTACLTLSLKSFLPKDIEVDEVTIELVSFPAYISALEDSTVVAEDEVFQVLRQGPVTITSGENELSFDWVPMASGQFILSSTTIKWRGARFSYLTRDQKRPTIRVDVVPSEPTQSIELTPDYLVPGHKQPVKMTFRAGSDIVKNGSIKFSCSDGLLLLSPENEDAETEESWSSSCESTLPPCPPDGIHEITVMVKTDQVNARSTTSMAEEQEGANSMHATVSTSYQRPFPEGIKDTGRDEKRPNAILEELCMDNVMGASICTLANPVLTIESIEMVAYAPDRTMLNVTLQCNIPASVVVKSWQISLPPFIALAENGDLNDCLSEARINTGELISMAFDCVYTNDSTKDSAPDAQRLMVEVQDEFGHCFQESLPLGLKRPTAPRISLPKELHAVSTELVPSTLQGLAGVPITLVYRMGTGELFSTLSSLSGSVRYQLAFDSADWIVCGKSEGLIQQQQQGDDAFALEFLSIPVRPGVIERYPSLSLSFQTSDNAAMPLQSVYCSLPGPFRSLPPPVHTTVAVPIPAAKQTRERFTE